MLFLARQYKSRIGDGASHESSTGAGATFTLISYTKTASSKSRAIPIRALQGQRTSLTVVGLIQAAFAQIGDGFGAA
jgi:hypothetical protein